MTRHRESNTRRLIAALEHNDMSWREIGALLNISVSGVRKYANELMEAHVAVKRLSDAGCYVLCLTTNMDVIKRLLATFSDDEPSPPKAPSPLEPGTYVHVMSDDESYVVKRQKHIPACDPLLAALFGLNKPQEEA